MCNEPFNPETGEAYEGAHVTLLIKPDPLLTDTLYRKWMTTCSSKYDGIKTHYSQLPPRLTQELVDNYTTIILYRKDSLKSALSYIIAKRTGTWHGWGDGSMKDYRNIKSVGRVELSELKPLMDVLLTSKRKALSKTGLKIAYEDLFCDEIENRITTLNQIMDQVSLPRTTIQEVQAEHPLHPNLKVTKNYSIIDNFEELKKRYEYIGLL